MNSKLKALFANAYFKAEMKRADVEKDYRTRTRKEPYFIV